MSLKCLNMHVIVKLINTSCIMQICMREKSINFSITEHRFTTERSVPGHLDEETGHQPGWICRLRVCLIERISPFTLLRQNIYDFTVKNNTQFSRSSSISTINFSSTGSSRLGTRNTWERWPSFDYRRTWVRITTKATTNWNSWGRPSVWRSRSTWRARERRLHKLYLQSDASSECSIVFLYCCKMCVWSMLLISVFFNSALQILTFKIT